MSSKDQHPDSDTGDLPDDPADAPPAHTHEHEEEHEHPPRQAYFVAGEIVLQAQHDAGIADDTLQSWANDFWEQRRLKDDSYPEIQFKPLKSPRFGNRDRESSLLKLQIPQFVQTEEDEEPELAEKDRQLVDVLNRLKTPLDSDRKDIRLQAAVPNWCLAGCTHGIAHVGPGAYPCPVDPADLHPGRHHFRKNKFDQILDNLHSAAHPIRQGQMRKPKADAPVNVVIFDTAPPRDALNAAYERIADKKIVDKKDKVGKKDKKDPYLNELLHTLRDDEKTGKFIIRYAEPKDLDIELPDNLTEKTVVDKEHPDKTIVDKKGYAQKDQYDMSDHGLFIAGTIRSIAPNANIYLVQTQNDFGMGTITSLAQGIEALINEKIIPHEKMHFPLIVNCSLCIEFETLQELQTQKPRTETEFEKLWSLNISRDVDIRAELPIGVDVTDITELLSLYTPLKQLQDHFCATGIHIIAAAGNDGLSPNQVLEQHKEAVAAAVAAGNNPPVLTDEQILAAYEPPQARYPAAFDFVIGVGSILKGGARAWYSNKADAPPRVGMMVFGGRALRPNGTNVTSATGEGMLGLYIGKFPETDTLSENGWGWWSGTSFSTGVMSGTFARAAAKGLATGFRQLIETQPDGTTDQDEPFIKTAQDT